MIYAQRGTVGREDIHTVWGNMIETIEGTYVSSTCTCKSIIKHHIEFIRYHNANLCHQPSSVVDENESVLDSIWYSSFEQMPLINNLRSE